LIASTSAMAGRSQNVSRHWNRPGLIEREGSIVRLAPTHLSISNEVFVALMR
jgi:hypothetical protein